MKLTTLATLVLGLGLSGCQMAARDFHYQIVVLNLSQERITETQVLDSTDEYNYGGGTISPKVYKVNTGPMSSPPNDVFGLRWKDAQGRTQEQKFDLRERVKRRFKGEIVFVHGPDMKFSVLIFKKQDEYQKLLPPPPDTSNVRPETPK